MPQTILEQLLKKIEADKALAPELALALTTLTRLNAEFKDKKLTPEDVTLLKGAFGAVKECTSSMIRNRDQVHEDFRKHIPALKAVQAPLDCYLKALEHSPAKLDDVLSDTGWIAGYFGEPERAREDPSYIEGSLNLDSMNINDAAALYKQEAVKAKEGYYRHVERISGDTEEPQQVLNEKIDVLYGYIGSLGSRDEFSYYAEAAKLGYQQAARPFDPEQYDADGPKKWAVMTDIHFEDMGAVPYNEMYVEGSIGRLKNVDKALIDLLQTETKKIRIGRSVLGLDKKTRDTIVETASKLTFFEDNIALLACDIPGFMGQNDILDEDPEHPAYPFYQVMRVCSDANAKLLHNAPDARPITAESFRELVNCAKQFVHSQSIQSEDGYNLLHRRMELIVKGLSVMYPELKADAAELHDAIREKVLTRYTELTEELSICRTPEKIDELFKKQRQLLNSGFITMEHFVEEGHYAMSLNPAFCDREIARAMKGLKELAQLNDETNDSFFHHSWTDEEPNIIDIKGSDVRIEACRLFLVGTLIKKQREAGVEIGDPTEYAAQFRDIDRNPVVSRLYQMNTRDLVAALEDPRILRTAVNMILSHENSYLTSVSGDSIAALTQESTSNSAEYNRIGDILKTIRQKDLTVTGASAQDFLSLTDACADYMSIRSSHAASPNGRKRFSAAAEVLRTVGPKAALALHEEAQKHIHTEMVLQMFRSKDFRRACIADAQGRITAIFGGADKISYEKCSALTNDQKMSLLQDVKLLTAARAVVNSLGNAGAEEILTEKNANAEEMDRFRNAAARLMDQTNVNAKFTEDPVEVLSRLLSAPKPSAKPQAGHMGRQL